MDKGKEDDWFRSHFIVTFSTLAVIGMIALVIWELRHAQGKSRPVLDLKLFAFRNLCVSFLIMFVLGSTLYATTVLLASFFNRSWAIQRSSPALPCPAEVWRRSYACPSQAS
jgi:MFS transporter, DHA2 family, multidrug resistance protein